MCVCVCVTHFAYIVEVVVGDIRSDDFATSRKAVRHGRVLKTKIQMQQKKIKGLQNTVRRLRTRITDLNKLLELLKRKLYITESSDAPIRVSVLVLINKYCNCYSGH